jgi:hypothetical protein
MERERYWVKYGLDGRVVSLFRLPYSTRSFERWHNGNWVADDRYFRVSQDAACDEIDEQAANELTKVL